MPPQRAAQAPGEGPGPPGSLVWDFARVLRSQARWKPGSDGLSRNSLPAWGSAVLGARAPLLLGWAGAEPSKWLCADLLWKIPGFKPVNSPRVTPN